MATPTEIAAIRRAVELSARGLATTRPNPVVGCVILAADGATVGEGWHARAGGAHAEVVALADAGTAARGGTAVVTLEPCAHTGRTPPCADALLAAGVVRVVVATRDPDPTAAGGAERLRAAGVDVETGVLTAEAEAVNDRWLTAVRRRRPHVTWKYAATLDGRLAAQDGTSRWITGEPARADVHRLRAGCDAILAGVGTVLADDAALTVRGVDNPAGPPLRVVVDTTGRTPAGARVLDGAAPTLLAVGPDATPPPGTDTVVLPLGPGGRGLDLGALLDALYARDVRTVLLEGGPTLAGSMVDGRFVDRVVGYVAPALLGGPPAYPALTGRGAAGIGDAVRLRLDDVTRIGTDLRLTATPAAGIGRDG